MLHNAAASDHRATANQRPPRSLRPIVQQQHDQLDKLKELNAANLTAYQDMFESSENPLKSYNFSQKRDSKLTKYSSRSKRSALNNNSPLRSEPYKNPQ